MKKLFLGLAALSLLFGAASCASETRESVTDGKSEISFRTVLGKQTVSRATEMDTDGLKTASQTTAIPVKVYKNSDNTLWADWTIEWNGTNAWEYNNNTPVYAPVFALNYYSWYPTTKVTNYANTAGVVTFDYEIESTLADQEDLIVASNVNTTVAEVVLKYGHLLSQVNFAVQNVADLKITIHSVTLANIANAATYTFNSGWNTRSGSTSYTYNSGVTTAQTDGTTATGSVSLASSGGALMLMPQTFGDTSTAAFTITYSLADAADNALATNQTATLPFNYYGTTTWTAGYRYLYLIDFTNYFTNVIKFSVEVDDWDDSTLVTLPAEVAQGNKSSIEGAINTLLTTYAGQAAYQVNVATILANAVELSITETPSATTTIWINCQGGLGGFGITLDAATESAGWVISGPTNGVYKLTFTV